MKNNIAAVRREKNITQKELANRVGLKRQYVGRIERGDIVPSVELGMKIAQELGVCICKLFESE